jgi:hypothetical protein
MLRLRPPNGWQAVGWELAIVTLGILIALGVQQWADQREWRAKARTATTALEEEVAFHYFYASEWRAIEPCAIAQIDRLKQRLLASGDRLDPAPIHSEPGYAFFVIRMPLREFEDSVWQSTIAEGVSSHLAPAMRRELNGHYARVRSMNELSAKNAADAQQLLSLSEPLPLDPIVRFNLLQKLNELRGRVEHMSFVSSLMIDYIRKAGLAPSMSSRAGRSKAADFCRAQRLPLRSWSSRR